MVSLDKTAKGYSHRKLEDHAWRLGVSEAFESDMYSMIAEILAQMFLRTSKGIGRERPDMEFLDYILSEKMATEGNPWPGPWQRQQHHGCAPQKRRPT